MHTISSNKEGKLHLYTLIILHGVLDMRNMYISVLLLQYRNQHLTCMCMSSALRSDYNFHASDCKICVGGCFRSVRMLVCLSVYLYACLQTLILPVLFDVNTYDVHLLPCIFLRSNIFEWHECWSRCDLDPVTLNYAAVEDGVLYTENGVFYVNQGLKVRI